ncbi:MAG TPA: TIGR04283 family arsenosugar biosynthesis glycosyltransferase [Longimicrobiaceae bacterium]|nr:TIGR04283 family arsenosugar biosynthesis glycosyltransferase [Longimicrobiaceae bacterium]
MIVPALNEAERIVACLRSVAAQAGPRELIVVDGGSTDGTPGLARELATVAAGPRGRAWQMNVGGRLARGEVLLFLHADSVLPAGALTALRDALADPRAAGGTFTLRFDTDRPWLRLYALLTRFRPRLFHYGDQGIFVRREVFERLGGFAELPLMEDVDFLRRLRREGRVVLVPRPVTTSARRFLARGIVRQQLLNGALVLLYHLGVAPARLARWYGVERR